MNTASFCFSGSESASSEKQGAGHFTDLRSIAYELHDGPVQWLAAAVVDLEILLASGSLSDTVAERARAAREKIRRALQELRAYIRKWEGEESAPEQCVDLRSEIVELCRLLEVPGRTVRGIFGGNLGVISASLCREVVQLVHEALSNALRHSDSREVWLSLAVVGSILQICVRDFGKGLSASSSGGEGLGLRSLTSRVRRLGGWITIEGAPQRGTRVFACIPVSALSASTENGTFADT